MNNEKKKLIRNYILKVLLILSLLMVIIPVVIAAFNTNILAGICVLGCFITILTVIAIQTNND